LKNSAALNETHSVFPGGDLTLIFKIGLIPIFTRSGGLNLRRLAFIHRKNARARDNLKELHEKYNLDKSIRSLV